MRRARTDGRHRQQRGFTLIELLMVMALVGLVMVLAIGGFRSFAKTELRGSASRLAGAIRYLFDRASTTGKIHRLVMDMDTGKYWAEVSDDRFYMPRERETEESRQEEAERVAEEEKAEKEQAEGEGDDGIDYSRYQPTEWKSKRAQFSMFQETALKPTNVRGAKIASVFTPRLAEPMTTGKAYIYFFPLGQTEPALVHVSDEEGRTFYSLLVHPLNGRVKIHGGYIEPRVDRQYDDEGKEIEEE